jgi:hypothetical protein
VGRRAENQRGGEKGARAIFMGLLTTVKFDGFSVVDQTISAEMI